MKLTIAYNSDIKVTIEGNAKELAAFFGSRVNEESQQPISDAASKFVLSAEKIKELIHELADSPSQKDIEKIVFETLMGKDISKFGASAKAVAEFLREVDAACERQNK